MSLLKRLRQWPSAIILLTALVLAACANDYTFNGTVLQDPSPASEILGTNYDGSTFRLSDHQGQVVMVYFGYTYCPDVCPTTMAELKQLTEKLGRKAGNVAVVFVTIDPDRDTQERLAQYVPAFDSRFYGVRLEDPALEQVKQAYGVYAEKHVEEGAQDTNTYLMDHSSGVYVIDRAGRLRELFSFDDDSDTMLPDIEHLLAEK
jgi:protein SCO1/2